eukprot:TRINITY_DN636_c0_g1_i1.p1 TRINITY_DN636_c0_g1~~TRINITY_DN636_c0_g1_i1.p1  ORF type:complete len:359 (+),score=115.91 TRINITY_DN636_c0_g1_i1:49-1125(+)
MTENWSAPLQKGEMKGPLSEETSYATLFPQYRESYLREIWGKCTDLFKYHGIKGILDLVEGSITVSTTRETFDPCAIIQARDMIKLLARSVPYDQAKRVFDEDTFCDVIKIKGLVKNRERYIKRRQRLIGSNGTTLKAIEAVSGCYILVQGGTVCAIGDTNGLQIVRDIVIDCMNNVHPVYQIEEMMIKNELAKDPKLANADWTRFLPNFKKRSSHIRRKRIDRKKKEYTPFPVPNLPRKEDLQMETGEYWLSDKVKKQREKENRDKKMETTSLERKKEKEQKYVLNEEAERVRNASLMEKQKTKHEVGDADDLINSLADKKSSGSKSKASKSKDTKAKSKSKKSKDKSNKKKEPKLE